MSVKICGTGQPISKSKEVCPPLSDRLIQLGFLIEDDIEKVDFLICFNHQKEVYESFKERGGKIENAVLIRLEPAAVFPGQYKPRVEDLYGQIITPGSLTSAPTIPWPYYFNQNPLQPEKNTPSLNEVVSGAIRHDLFKYEQWKQRPIRLSLIASNKVSSSSNNNYRIRRRLAQSLPKELLSVYGGLWTSNLRSRLHHRAGVLSFALNSRILPNMIELYGSLFRRYPSAVGMIRDKHEIIRKSQFSLVVENDNDYVSEKLIDALLSGSLPIYFGGDCQRVGIPTGLVITDLRDERAIVEFLDNISQQEVLDFQRRLEEWLKSPSFYERWAGDNVFATIADEIADYFRKMVP
jgi:hypothetical protein